MIYKPQTGDVIVIWERTKGGKRLQWLIELVFGVKEAATHTVIVINDTQDIGAENVVKLVDRQRCLGWRSYKAIIGRHKKMTKGKQKKLLSILPKYLGRKYDVFLYILWLLRIAIVFRPLLWLFAQPFYNWMQREERKRYGCSELTTTLLQDIGIDMGVDDPTNVPPHYIAQIIRVCSDWKIVFEK